MKYLSLKLIITIILLIFIFNVIQNTLFAQESINLNLDFLSDFCESNRIQISYFMFPPFGLDDIV